MSMNSRLLQRARELQRAGRYIDACAVLDAVLAAEPENEAAWQLRLALSDTPADRERVLRARLRLRPDAVEWWEQLVELKASEVPVPPQRQHYRRLYVAAALLVAIVACAALYFVSHNPLQKDVDRLTANNLDLTNAYTQLDRAHQNLKTQYRALQQAQVQLQNDLSALKASHAELNAQHIKLTADYQALSETHAQLLAYADQLNISFTQFRSTAIAPPYIYIHGRTVDLAFVRIDKTIGRWTMPFEWLEYDIERGYYARQVNLARLHRLEPYNTRTNETYRILDYREFVDAKPFQNVMAELYHDTGGGDAFLRETWNIVTQLTTYTNEINDTPRYPFETFLAGGGDCEDTSILLASLLKAAPVSWKVSLVYLDLNNPLYPQTINHVAVYVDTGMRQYFLETTTPDVMEPYPNGIDGWYYEVQ